MKFSFSIVLFQYNRLRVSPNASCYGIEGGKWFFAGNMWEMIYQVIDRLEQVSETDFKRQKLANFCNVDAIFKWNFELDFVSFQEIHQQFLHSPLRWSLFINVTNFVSITHSTILWYVLYPGQPFSGSLLTPLHKAGSKGLVFMINFSRSTFKVIYQVIFSVTTCHLFGYLKRLGGTKRGKYSFEVCPCFKWLKGRLALPLIHESTRTLKSSFPPELEVATMVIKY